MVEPIADPEYWKQRLLEVNPSNFHHSIMKMDIDLWQAVESNHRRTLAKYIKPNDSILDAGCGYGRLAYLLPTTWRGEYLGIDLSPDFIKLAERTHPDLDFTVSTIEDVGHYIRDLEKASAIRKPRFDYAVCISIRRMVICNQGEETWARMLRELKKVSKNVMILEYEDSEEVVIL